MTTKEYSDEEKFEIDYEDSSCIEGIRQAQMDFKKGILKTISVGLLPLNSPLDEYTEIMKNEYGIIVEHIGCIVSSYDECYDAIMDSVITDKYGDSIYRIVREESREFGFNKT